MFWLLKNNGTLSRLVNKIVSEEESDNAFWGGKIDWNINENHRVEFLMFSDDVWAIAHGDKPER